LAGQIIAGKLLDEYLNLDYAKSEPDKREGILTAIRAKAEELQKRLKADVATME